MTHTPSPHDTATVDAAIATRRSVRGFLPTPVPRATIEEILEVGGICMDQSHFGTTAARAYGIPAASVGGDGNRGGHAWFAYLMPNHQWNMGNGFRPFNESGKITGIYGAGGLVSTVLELRNVKPGASYVAANNSTKATMDQPQFCSTLCS
jgi:hypothetical protein